MNNDPVFPPELFAVIIGTLAHDLETLRSCALVSSTFHGLARVFSHIQVGPLIDQEHNIGRLCELLEGSPHFAARVESLRICVEWKRLIWYSCWIMKADLGRCFSLLPSLTRLCIAVDGTRFDWLKLSQSNRHSIQAILPTLTCLELKAVSNWPLALFSHCSSLRSLTLENVSFADSLGAVAATDSRSSIHLRHLVLRVRASSFGQFVDWVTSPESPFDISCLHSLDFRADDRSLPIQRLLNAASSSLQRLCIQNHNSVAHELPELDLRQLSHLLALDIYLVDSDPYNHLRLFSLRNFAFPPPPQSQIALILDIMTDGEPRRTDIRQNLAVADHILCRLPFETVTVILRAWDPEDIREKKLIDVRDEFVPAMPRLASKPGRTDSLRILESIPVPRT